MLRCFLVDPWPIVIDHVVALTEQSLVSCSSCWYGKKVHCPMIKDRELRTVITSPVNDIGLLIGSRLVSVCLKLGQVTKGAAELVVTLKLGEVVVATLM